MTSPSPVVPVNTAFNFLPSGLKKDLLDAFGEIVNNFSEGRWEPSELNGGKFAEAVYTILEGHIAGTFRSRAIKPRNMVDACKLLEQAPRTIPRSVKIQMPRVIIAVYEIRNNRGVGHAGGDVDPNHMDALFVLESSKWLMAELVRVFHQTSLEEAQTIVETVIERNHPLIWKTEGLRRVLLPTATYKEKTLMLLHSTSGYISEDDLITWIEHSNPSVYRRDVLRPCHRDKLIEYDEIGHRVSITPLGIRYREEKLPLGRSLK